MAWTADVPSEGVGVARCCTHVGPLGAGEFSRRAAKISMLKGVNPFEPG